MIIDHGQEIADDTAGEAEGRPGRRPITITADDEADARRAAEIAGRIPSAREITVDAMTMTPARAARRRACCPSISCVAGRGRCAGAHRGGHPPTLDDVFLALTGRSLRESAKEPERVNVISQHRHRVRPGDPAGPAQPVGLAFRMAQPLVFLLLFGPLLSASRRAGSPWQWFVPGILVMLGLFGTEGRGIRPTGRMARRLPGTDAGDPARAAPRC